MKNILLLAALAVGLAACTSVEDNPSSVVDNGKWTVDPGAIDLSVQPGDNFYQYAVGSILKKNKITTTGEPDMKGYLDYVVKSIHDSRCDALDRPSLNVLTKHVSDMNATSKQAQQLLAAQCAWINAATTLEEAWQLTGQLIAEGSATPCSFSALNMNGRINFYIDVPVSAIENISSSVRPQKSSTILTSSGVYAHWLVPLAVPSTLPTGP